MKTQIKLTALALFSAFSLAPSGWLHAATTIDGTKAYAYGANLGWMDWRGDIASGAVIGEYVCSGYIYAANIGWINLGSGSPANQIQYQNNSATDFGVNQDGLGNLNGYAYGANVGWINFEQTYGKPRVDLLTGRFSGSVWCANCGWITLSNAFASVRTKNIQNGELAPNGLPNAWLLQNFGTTNVNAGADADGDGVSNGNEYQAGTDPNKAQSVLKITSITRGTPTPADMTLTWTSVNTRFYTVQERPSLSDGTWEDYVSNPVMGGNSISFPEPNATNAFFRVRAYRPLIP